MRECKSRSIYKSGSRQIGGCRHAMGIGERQASYADMASYRQASNRRSSNSQAKNARMLSGGMRSVRTIVMLWRGHLWLVCDMSLLWRICIKHDASLRCLSSQRAGGSLAVVRKSLGVVGAAHEEQSIDSVFLCLLARHAKDTSSRCCWRARTSTEIASMFSLTRTKQWGRWM